MFVVVDIGGTCTIHAEVIIGWCCTLGDMLIRHWRTTCEAGLVGQAMEYRRKVHHPDRVEHKDSNVVGSMAQRLITRIALIQGDGLRNEFERRTQNSQRYQHGLEYGQNHLMGWRLHFCSDSFE